MNVQVICPGALAAGCRFFIQKILFRKSQRSLYELPFSGSQPIVSKSARRVYISPASPIRNMVDADAEIPPAFVMRKSGAVEKDPFLRPLLTFDRLIPYQSAVQYIVMIRIERLCPGLDEDSLGKFTVDVFGFVVFF